MAKPNNTALEAAMPSVEEEQEGWVYVTVPDRDILDFPFAGIGINLQHYGPGTHRVPADIAKEINERIRIAQKQDLKLFSAKVNIGALAQLYNSPNFDAGAVQEHQKLEAK